MVISKGYSLLKAWRVFMRLTQKDVAKALGISQSAVSQIEKTGVIPRKYTLEKLASVLNVDAKLIID
ncbi:MAG: helix-turn-helix transcriptional regulator [Candidatus Marinimicrobia bacterium]|nr:helix-turn-helix transcriptional regulator [Candidatus Neomarinimicrobiota bacterium]